MKPSLNDLGIADSLANSLVESVMNAINEAQGREPHEQGEHEIRTLLFASESTVRVVAKGLSPLWLGETPSPEVIRNQVLGYMKGKACAAREEEANAPTHDARSTLNKRATMFELAAEALEEEHG